MRRVGLLVVLGSVALAHVAWGRGESWMPAPPVPPPLESLTNEACYIEWKFRTDVTDVTTGLTADALKKKVNRLWRELEKKDDWRMVKAKCYCISQ